MSMPFFEEKKTSKLLVITDGESIVNDMEKGKRIASLDVLRGTALLGILAMNVQSFSTIAPAYFNPTASGDLTGLNWWVWVLSHILTDSKCMAIFSMLFGAGIVLMAERAHAKGLSPAALHYRRMLGLFIIGMLHAYLLWYGDILVWYSLSALVVYLFRKVEPKWLLIIGLVCLLIPTYFAFSSAREIQHASPEEYQQELMQWQPDRAHIEMEIGIYQGSWLRQMLHRIPVSLMMQTVFYVFWGFWRVSGLMLIGMALYKLGIVSGERSKQFYFRMMVIGSCIGLPPIIYGIIVRFADGWSFEYSKNIGTLYNYWGSIPMSLAYIGAIVWVCKSGVLSAAAKALANVGRLALSNYLFQTIACTTIFYGHGLGWFGQVERVGQIGIVFLVWAVQLFVSAIWLRYFRLGPFEWLWRTFTYLNIQPVLATNGTNRQP